MFICLSPFSPPPFFFFFLQERLAEFQKKHYLLVAQVQDELAAFLKAHTTLTEEDQLTKAEFNARLEVLKDAMKNFSDPGPVYDCVVFHDGNVWRVAVDTKENGHLGGKRDLCSKTYYQRQHIAASVLLSFVSLS